MSLHSTVICINGSSMKHLNIRDHLMCDDRAVVEACVHALGKGMGGAKCHSTCRHCGQFRHKLGPLSRDGRGDGAARNLKGQLNWQGQTGAEGSAKEAWRKREAAEGSVGSSKFSSWRSERRLMKRAWCCGKGHDEGGKGPAMLAQSGLQATQPAAASQG